MKNVLSMIKLGLVLGAFATAACVMLAFVYTGTFPIIAMREEAALKEAFEELFPGADSYEEVKGIGSPDPSVTIHTTHQVIQGGMTTGMVLRVSRGGYGGPIVMTVGVSADRMITGVKILDLSSETPGLGANAGSPKYFVDRARRITFYGQFTGKNAGDPFEVNNDVDVITASTITSRAIASAVRAAGIAVTAWLDGVEVDAISSAAEGGVE